MSGNGVHNRGIFEGKIKFNGVKMHSRRKCNLSFNRREIASATSVIYFEFYFY
jgi:hypothetical protein